MRGDLSHGFLHQNRLPRQRLRLMGNHAPPFCTQANISTRYPRVASNARLIIRTRPYNECLMSPSQTVRFALSSSNLPWAASSSKHRTTLGSLCSENTKHPPLHVRSPSSTIPEQTKATCIFLCFLESLWCNDPFEQYSTRP